MNFTVHSSNKKKDLDKFYQIGSEVRQNNLEGMDTDGTQNIDSVIDDENVEIRYFYIQSESGGARVAAYIEGQDLKMGYLGWYECDDNMELSKKILSEAMNWLQLEGCSHVIGPIDGSTWGNYRFNLSSSTPLFAGEPYQPLYYVDQWINVGFTKKLEYESSVPTGENTNLSAISADEHFSNIGLKLLKFPRVVSEKLNNQLFEMYHTCFARSPLFKPISFDTYEKLSEKAAKVVDYDCSFVVLDDNNDPAAVFISYMDVYNALNAEDKKRRLYIKTIAAHPKWQNLNIMQYSIQHIKDISDKFGYDEVVFAMMFLGNVTSIKSKKVYNPEVLRSYALFSKEL